MKTFLVSDTHFGHANILRFKNEDGSLIRGALFSSVEEMDETMVANWNAVVSPEDKVYHLGDVVMSKKALPILSRLNGRKTLIAGNHDIFNTSEYMKYFDNVRGCRVVKTKGHHNVILTHIPISFENRGRFAANIHGHLHQNKMKNPWYVNVSVEHTNYTPVDINTILDEIDANYVPIYEVK